MFLFNFYFNFIINRMSDNVEITVTNPLNILDDIDENNYDDSETSGELSYDSDDELSDLYSILNEGDNESPCYVCYDKTIYISPCQCKISICNDCFIDVIINNGKSCTICKDRFDESIILDVKNNFSEVSHSSAELTRSLRINRNNTPFKSFLCFSITVMIFISAPIFGMITRLVLHGYFFGDIFTFENYIIGLVFWVNMIILVLSVRFIYKLFKFLYDELINYIFNYFFRG